MQAAYQEFMLKGKKKNTANSRDEISTSLKPKGTPSILHGSTPSSSKKKYTANGSGLGTGSSAKTTTTPNKAVRPIFKAFQGRLHDWKDANDQSEQVLRSILNLRDRLAWESDHLLRAHEVSSPSKESLWRGWGFRDSITTSNALLEEDVELALHHDLLQHERMQGALRGLVSSMGQAMDAMGRRLDEWMMASMQYADHNDGGGGAHPSLVILEEAQHAYSFLSEELYRKQILIRNVFDSCHDGLVDQESKDVSTRLNPRQVALDACKEWKPRDTATQAVVDKLLNMP